MGEVDEEVNQINKLPNTAASPYINMTSKYNAKGLVKSNRYRQGKH